MRSGMISVNHPHINNMTTNRYQIDQNDFNFIQNNALHYNIRNKKEIIILKS